MIRWNDEDLSAELLLNREKKKEIEREDICSFSIFLIMKQERNNLRRGDSKYEGGTPPQMGLRFFGQGARANFDSCLEYYLFFNALEIFLILNFFFSFCIYFDIQRIRKVNLPLRSSIYLLRKFHIVFKEINQRWKFNQTSCASRVIITRKQKTQKNVVGTRQALLSGLNNVQKHT